MIKPKECKQLVYVGLGGNIGPTRQIHEAALSLILQLPIEQLQVSSFYLTTPVSDLPQNCYLNAVCSFYTQLTPDQLLTNLQTIQQQLGQQEKPKNAPRLIDLDILFFGNLDLNLSHLQIPHPCWRERLFVLIPLAELTSYITLPSQVLVDLNEEIRKLQLLKKESVIRLR